MSDHPLETRSGLPDALAYLRPSYARAGWRSHANFGELSNFWLQVHDSLRQEGSVLRQATADYREGRLDGGSYRRLFPRNLNHFLQHLNGHHQIEDHLYFPKFRALDRRMAVGFDLLEQDHRQIHDALLASAQSAQQFLAAFERGGDDLQRAGEAYADAADRLLARLLRHLADEEDLIIPAMLHHGERQVR
jgi:iron-sulfur cluster repair protein YtfE (RIC family)